MRGWREVQNGRQTSTFPPGRTLQPGAGSCWGISADPSHHTVRASLGLLLQPFFAAVVSLDVRFPMVRTDAAGMGNRARRAPLREMAGDAPRPGSRGSFDPAARSDEPGLYRTGSDRFHRPAGCLEASHGSTDSASCRGCGPYQAQRDPRGMNSRGSGPM